MENGQWPTVISICTANNKMLMSTSPPIAAVAPMSAWSLVISFFGPAISEVPLSTIA